VVRPPVALMSDGTTRPWSDFSGDDSSTFAASGLRTLRNAMVEQQTWRHNNPGYTSVLEVVANGHGVGQITTPFAPGDRSRNIVITPTRVTLTAAPDSEDVADFFGWFINGQLVSEDLVTQVTISANTVVEARFYGYVVEDPEFTINFVFYTDSERILEAFEDYGTIVDDLLVVELPVVPGQDREEWENQELLEAILAVGHFYGTEEATGFAFWGWFTDETLEDSERINPDTELRRPALGDQCALEGLLALIEAGDEEVIEDLFGYECRTLDLFAVWSLWGDVNDDDYVDGDDLELLRQFIFYSHLEDFVLNENAANVVVDNNIDSDDLELLRQFLFYNHLEGVNIVLGVKP
jgi:hypothetical protein